VVAADRVHRREDRNCTSRAERWDDLQARPGRARRRSSALRMPRLCVGWLLSAPPTKSAAPGAREPSHDRRGVIFSATSKRLEALAGNILPELIRARRGREQRLRIWSAACLHRRRAVFTGDPAASEVARFAGLGT